MRAFLLLATVLLLGACGGLAPTGDPDLPEQITGDQVGRMAERQLEQAHDDLAPGTITCPDLELETGAKVRCERVAELDQGRRVRVLGTVTVTSTDGGGRLHVQLDDEVVEVGVTGEHLEDDVLVRATSRFGSAPDGVSCPYLLGEVGHRVRCRLVLGKQSLVVPVVVTSSDPRASTVTYRFLWPRVSAAVKRSLAYVAADESSVVD